MKRKILAALVVVVLLTVGLGSLAYAQEEPANQFHVWFTSMSHIIVVEDNFTNGEVTGYREWGSGCHNTEDASGAPVTDLALSLASDTEYAMVFPEPVTMGPPLYEWFFGDVPEGYFVGDRSAGVSNYEPVTFTPGFSASRSADATDFSEPGVQTLTITVDLQKSVTGHVGIDLRLPQVENITAVITSPDNDLSGEPQFRLSDDGQQLFIGIHEPVEGTTYSFDVTIEVTPNVPEVRFMPHIYITAADYLSNGNAEGSSLPLESAGLGTWTWSATGDYAWNWNETEWTGVHLAGYSEEIPGPPSPPEPSPHESLTGQKLVGYGNLGTLMDIVQANFSVSFTNPDCVSEVTIDQISIIREDGQAVFEGRLSELPVVVGNFSESPFGSGDVLEPHHTVGFPLVLCIPDGSGGWLTQEEALALPFAYYTVEVFYSVSQPGGLPLIGQIIHNVGPPGATEPVGMVPMVNMEQVLEPPIQLVFNDHNPPGTGPAVAMDYWAERVEELCGGRVDITVYHGATLLTGDEVYEGIQTGIADGGNYVAALEDGFRLNLAMTLPFMGWPDQQDTGRIYERLLQRFPEMRAEWQGVEVLGTFMMPDTHIHTVDTVITAPADIAGVKIFCTDASMAEIMNAVGATAVELPITDMAPAVMMGVADGVFQHFPVCHVFGALELLPYHTVFGDGGVNMTPIHLIINKDVLDSLPRDIQRIILDSGHFWYDKFKEVDAADQAEAIAFCEASGHTMTYLTPEEIEVWYELVEGTLHADWIAECQAAGLPGQALYEEVLRLIRRY